MDKKTLLLLIPASVVIAVLVIGLLLFLGIPVYPLTQDYCGCHSVLPEYFFLVFGILLVVAVTPISYYFGSKKMEEKLDKQLDILTSVLSKNKSKQKNENSTNRQSVLKLLSTGEQLVLDKLIEGNGSVMQAEISRDGRMTKLKAHRAIKSLEQKGIITKESYGKTNKLVLNEDTKNLLID